MARSANLEIMIRAATRAARTLARDFGEVEQLQVSIKGPGDFVSAADRRAEQVIKEELKRGRPDYGFVMEESAPGVFSMSTVTMSRSSTDPIFFSLSTSAARRMSSATSLIVDIFSSVVS